MLLRMIIRKHSLLHKITRSCMLVRTISEFFLCSFCSRVLYSFETNLFQFVLNFMITPPNNYITHNFNEENEVGIWTNFSIVLVYTFSSHKHKSCYTQNESNYRDNVKDGVDCLTCLKAILLISTFACTIALLK